MSPEWTKPKARSKNVDLNLGLDKIFSHGSSNSLTNGAPLLQVVEHARLTITRSYLFRPYKTKTDFTALAKLKWISGCTNRQLAQTFEVEEETITGYLRKLRKLENLRRLKLSEREIAKIQETICGENFYDKIG